MGRFTGFDEVYSALYVDFDNIYTRFLEMDPELARAFGSMPARGPSLKNGCKYYQNLHITHYNLHQNQ